MSELEPSASVFQHLLSMSSSFPDSVIVVGAGAFGLSTALAIDRRFPSTRITVVDHLTPPVLDGTSVDTSRIIRPGRS